MKLFIKNNNRGFTLVELLAVIVILALILAIGIPTITSAIDNSKRSTLHTKAKEIVSWYEKTIVLESMMEESERIIKDTDIQKVEGGTKNCLDQFSINFQKTLNLEEVKTNGLPPTGTNQLTANNCSYIVMENDEIKVVLIAKQGGKFDVGGGVTYADSSASTGVTQ